jgi:hypothetical protein
VDAAVDPPGGMSGGHRGGSPAPEKRAVIFEFQQIGNSVKVSAIDEKTGVEVSIVGPASALRSDLEKVARAKLMRALEKQKQ